MAFSKTARAAIVHPNWGTENWARFVEEHRKEMAHTGYRGLARTASGSPNLVSQASQILQDEFSPEKYLLTHATIVASVDTDDVPGIRLGAVNEMGRQINRKWANYRVKPSCDIYINNNHDCWDRPVLLKSYRTFVGAHNFCFAPGTKIMMGDGTYRPIEELSIGDEVVTHKGRVRRVTHVFEREYEGDIRSVKFDRFKDPVLVTGNHPFRSIEVSAPATKIRPGTKTSNAIRYRRDQIARGLRGERNVFNGAFSAEKGWRNAEDLEEGSYVLGAERVAGETQRTSEAILLGYYLAEGCPMGEKSGSDGFVLSFGPHEQSLALDAKKCVEDLWPDARVAIRPSQTSLRAEVFASGAREWCIRMGGHLAPQKRIDASVFSWDRESLLRLLGAWMTGDGSLHKGTLRLRGTTTSRDLADQMQRVAEIVGVKSSVVFERRKIGEKASTVSMVVGGENQSFDVISRHHSHTVLVSKESVPEIATRSIRWPNLHVASSRKRSELAWWEDCRVHRVASNSSLPYAGKVYNIEVEEDHSYVIDHGIAVHNCEHVQIEEQSKGRIIDAAARDIGDSIYVDILIATDRRHASLIRDIESGRMGTMSMGCFLAGTQVTMGDGTRVAIEDVAPGDMVLTHKGRVREVLNKQIRMYRGELRHIRAVGVSSPIRATANHGFHVLRAPRVCACGCGEDLPTTSTQTRRMTRRFKTGHDKRIFNPNNTYSLEEARRRKAEIASIKELTFEKVRADELSVGDFLAFPRSADGVKGGWTPGKARLVGYFLAEGSYLKRQGERIEVQFNFSMGEKNTYVREVVDLLRREFPDANEPWTQERPERDTCVVHMTGRDAVSWFYEHCGEYSHRKRMSREVMSLPVELHKHVVGAWINGDGTFGDANKTLSGTTVSYDLACQMHHLLSRCGVFARMECKQDGCNIELAQAIGADWMPNPETGKRPSLTLVMGLTGQEGLRGFSDKVGRKTQSEQQLRMLDDYVIFPVSSIESDWYEGPVHNMEVDEDHTYVVEGVTVYNCSVTETQCTKCGNVAADETEMCEHIKYAKGNYEFDSQGRKYRIAELCGHETLDPTGGVTFIEASWVAIPAFQGAVMRNVLAPESVNINTQSQMRSILASPPREWTTNEGMAKAARAQEAEMRRQARVAQLYRAGEEEEEAPDPMAPPPGDDAGGGAPDPMAPAPGGAPDPMAPPGGGMPGAPGGEEKDPMEELEGDIEKYVLDKIRKKIKDKLTDEVSEDAATDPELATSKNENLNKQAAQLVAGTEALLRIARSDIELLDGLARLKASFGLKVSRDLYRTALRVGSTDGHESLEGYLQRCAEVLTRKPTVGEAKTLVRLGRILSLRKKTRF